MINQSLAIATCRVSSLEQLDSNSLNRQAESVKNAANDLNVRIPEDGIWSGSISSKAGNNHGRKDLKEMLNYCKAHPRVKYLIVDEIDRFMRSIDEMFYFEVLFRQEAKVKVWYAGDPGLNSDDPATKLMRALEAFKAEGSNLERQIKSIKGQTAALAQGRYPFPPKPGYKRGYEKGIHELHPEFAIIMRSILLQVVNRELNPSQALVAFNKSKIMFNRSPYKMDKFRKILTDPYYAGIVEINKQVKLRNENGLHQPLITIKQHEILLRIMQDKKKNQSGPRQNGNPKYPLSNLVTCELCINERNGRLVGFDHGNGKVNSPIYEKYRCRSCKRYMQSVDLHAKVKSLLNNTIPKDGSLKHMENALETVWKQRQAQAGQEILRIKHSIKNQQEAIRQQVEAATDPSNELIKQDIMTAIADKKEKLTQLEEQLNSVNESNDQNKMKFLHFAYDFTNNLGNNFFELSQENRLRCKQLIFPGGFNIDRRNKVYTPEISLLYRYTPNKKDLSRTEKSLLVRVRGL